MQLITKIDAAYRDLIWNIRHYGKDINTRNSKVQRLISAAVVIDETPLVTIRKTAWKSAIREWEWFMSGSSNINDLHPSVRKWWQPWADENGEVRNNYSKQFRRYNEKTEYYEDYESMLPPKKVVSSFDQMQAFVDGIKHHPYSRRNILTTWHAEEMYDPETPITSCHQTVTQAFVDNDGVLDLATYQRSVDVICGLPHNWIQLHAFHLWLAAVTGTTVGRIYWTGGDVHIYQQHQEIVDKLQSLVTADIIYSGCYPEHNMYSQQNSLIYTKSSDDFKADDFSLQFDYKPIFDDKAEMVV